MVEPQPTKKPIWNTGGANRTEPTTGEKVTGWALDDQPPSSYFNWLQYYAGAWITWLNERVYKGSTEIDLVVSALAPTAPGTGGDLDVSAGDALGTDNTAGELTLESGASTGTAGGRIDINVSAGETGGSGSGSYTNTKARFMRLDGASGNNTVYVDRYTEYQNPVGIDALRGVARYRTKVQPTAPPVGDVYLDSATEQFRLKDTNGYRGGATPLFDTPFLSSFTVSDSLIERPFSTTGPTNILYTIPANYLSTGSLIRAKIMIGRAGSPDEPGFNLWMGPVGTYGTPPSGGAKVAAVAPKAGAATLFTFTIDAEIYVVAAGSPATIECRAIFIAKPASLDWQAPQVHQSNFAVASLSTTVALEFFPTVQWNATGGSNTATLQYFSVDVI